MTRAQQTQTAPAAEQQTTGDQDFARLISKNSRIGGLYKQLSSREEKIEAMLPDFMKGQAPRLIARALMTFNNKLKDMQDCPDEDFCRCVVEAAELGFAIDGKLAYVVKYKAAYQLQLDYKAMIAVAKRNRTIIDIDAEVVCEHDHFKHGKYGGTNILEHTFSLSSQRGQTIGAYCRVFLPGGQWNYGVMDRATLDKIQATSKAKYDGRPWDTWEGEMQKKSVIRRTLKLYQDDPGLMRMLELTSWEDDKEDEPDRPHTIADLGKTLTGQRQSPQHDPSNGNGHRHEAHEAPAEVASEPPLKTEPDPSEDFAALARMELSDAQTIGDVQAVKASLLRKATTDADQSLISGLCESREAEIRGGRGERSNTKQKTLAGT